MSEATPWPHVRAWHDVAARRLSSAIASARLGHALLLCGMPGIGKQAFARWLTHTLLCTQRTSDGDACGSCKSCQLLRAGTHPDRIGLTPEEAGKSIGVDAVREFSARLALTAQYAGNRVGSIAPAEAMTHQAANSLLKTLEEPPAGTYLILVADFPARLLPTVRSRCQRVELRRPARELALAWLGEQLEADDAARWLNVARGAPLRAMQLAMADEQTFRRELFTVFENMLKREQDPLAAAAGYQRANLAAALHWLDSWVCDLIRIETVGAAAVLGNEDLAPALRAQQGKLDLQTLFGYLDRVRETAASSISFNRQLVFEELFINASRLRGPSKR